MCKAQFIIWLSLSVTERLLQNEVIFILVPRFEEYSQGVSVNSEFICYWETSWNILCFNCC